jgi:hypothetical protein
MTPSWNSKPSDGTARSLDGLVIRFTFSARTSSSSPRRAPLHAPSRTPGDAAPRSDHRAEPCRVVDERDRSTVGSSRFHDRAPEPGPTTLLDPNEPALLEQLQGLLITERLKPNSSPAPAPSAHRALAEVPPGPVAIRRRRSKPFSPPAGASIQRGRGGRPARRTLSIQTSYVLLRESPAPLPDVPITLTVLRSAARSSGTCTARSQTRRPEHGRCGGSSSALLDTAPHYGLASERWLGPALARIHASYVLSSKVGDWSSPSAAHGQDDQGYVVLATHRRV